MLGAVKVEAFDPNKTDAIFIHQEYLCQIDCIPNFEILRRSNVAFFVFDEFSLKPAEKIYPQGIPLCAPTETFN